MSASALTIATGSFVPLRLSSAQRADCSIREAQRKHLLITCGSLISTSSREALTTSCMLELTKGGGNRLQESPVYLPEFKNKAVLWVTALVWLSFKIRHKRKLNKPSAIDSSRSKLMCPYLGSWTESFSLNSPLCVVNTHFSCGL